MCKRHYFLLLFQTAFCLTAFTQNGLLWEDTAYLQVPLLKVDRGIYPLQINLRKYCPVPGDQGDYASCTGWALAHALTIRKAILANETLPHRIEALRFSEAYIFNQVKLGKDCLSGAYLSHALDLLKRQGDCPASIFHTSGDCKVQPEPSHHLRAAPFRIVNYKRLFSPGDSPDVKASQIRWALSRQHPVVVAMNVPPDLRNTPLDKLDWSAKAPKTGHALVLVGYDDKRREVELMNSYGEKWGDCGFFRLPYEVFFRHLMYGYWLDLGEGFGKR